MEETTKKHCAKEATHRHREEERVDKVQQELENMFRFDPRGRNSVGAELIGSNVNPVLPLEVLIKGDSLGGWLLAPITYASMRGWVANVSNPSFPHFAYIYMTRALQNFCQGGDVITGTVPLWFALMVQAVVRKTVKMKAGKVNYQFTVNSEASEFWVLGMGPSVFGKAYTFGRKASPPVYVNGDIPTLVPPTAYTDELGQNAIQSLWNFLSAQNHTHPAMHKPVSVTAPNKMTNDPSSFALNVVWPGGGFNQTGGFFTRAELEVFCKSPIFSTLVSRQGDIVPNNRFPNHILNRSGDSVALGGMLVSSLHPKQIHMKNVTSYKFIDFYEVLDVMARWICAVQQNRVETSFFDTKFQSNPNFFTEDVQYPLTMQQLSLLLRATVLSGNQEDQLIGQALFPRAPTSNNDNEFISFICGQFLMPVPLTSQMLLPLLLKENLLSLRGRTVKNGKRNSNPIRDVTIYGIYDKDQLDQRDFTVSWTIDKEDYTESCFASNAGEIAISPVDGSFGQLQYAAINDPSYLMGLAVQHNEWIQKNSDTERVTDTLGSDNGVDALYCGGITRYWITQEGSDGGIPEKKSITKEGMSKKEISDYNKFVSRVTSKELKTADTGPYAEKAVIAYTFGYQVFLQPWQSLQQFFITPVLKVDNRNNRVEEATNVYQMGAALGEPLNIIPAQGDESFPTLAVAHQSFAELMVKQPFADKSAYDSTLVALTQKGEAGILGVLGSQVLNAFGHPGVDLASGLIRDLVPM